MRMTPGDRPDPIARHTADGEPPLWRSAWILVAAGACAVVLVATFL